LIFAATWRGADSAHEYVVPAVQELELPEVFERAVLVINATTGTGSVDENVVDSSEFAPGDNIAQVAIQLSYRMSNG